MENWLHLRLHLWLHLRVHLWLHRSLQLWFIYPWLESQWQNKLMLV